jgi:hypothetical protein
MGAGQPQLGCEGAADVDAAAVMQQGLQAGKGLLVAVVTAAVAPLAAAQGQTGRSVRCGSGPRQCRSRRARTPDPSRSCGRAAAAAIPGRQLHHPLLAGCPWLLPTPQRFQAAANWLELVRQGGLDGALISGLELEEAEGLNHQELELLPLGELPLALAFCRKAPVLVGAAPAQRRQQPADPRRLDRPDPGQPPGSGGSRTGGRQLGLPAALAPGPPVLGAAGPWSRGSLGPRVHRPQVPGLPPPQSGVAGANDRQTGAAGAAPHRPGTRPGGRLALAGRLGVCDGCIGMSQGIRGIPQCHRGGWARCRLAAASPLPHASPAAAGGPAIDPMASMTPDLVQAQEALQPEEGR